MVSKKRLYLQFLQNIISWESAISTPGTSSWLRQTCLKAMGVNAKGSVWIGENTWFVNPDRLVLGSSVAIGEASRIACHAPVVIGDNFLAASGLYIDSGFHDVNTLVPSESPIIIGNRVWCGMKVTICSGVSIGDDVVIGAGAVVTRSIPSGWLAVGIPAKPIKRIERSDTDRVWTKADALGIK